jgi:hypothetical protein
MYTINVALRTWHVTNIVKFEPVYILQEGIEKIRPVKSDDTRFFDGWVHRRLKHGYSTPPLFYLFIYLFIYSFIYSFINLFIYFFIYFGNIISPHFWIPSLFNPSLNSCNRFTLFGLSSLFYNHTRKIMYILIKGQSRKLKVWNDCINWEGLETFRLGHHTFWRNYVSKKHPP